MRSALFVLVFLPAIICAQQKDSASTERHSTSGAYQRGSDSAPISVKLLNTGKSNTETAQETHRIETDEKAASRAFWLTVAVVIVSLLQFAALGLTYSIMRDTARRQLRAYIGARFPSRPVIVAGEPVKVEFTLNNFGQTPARIVEVRGALQILPYPTPDNVDFSDAVAIDAPQSPMTCYPGDEGKVWEGVKILRPLTQPEVNDIWAGTSRRLYCYGRIDYKDVFGIGRYTEYCVLIGGEGHETGFEWCGHNNDAT